MSFTPGGCGACVVRLSVPSGPNAGWPRRDAVSSCRNRPVFQYPPPAIHGVERYLRTRTETRGVMSSLTTLVQALGIAYASGISPYATVALAGIANRMGWIDTLPGALGAVSHPVVIALASVLTVIEFLATLIPGVASVDLTPTRS